MLVEAAQADAADEAAPSPSGARRAANQADRLERIRRAQQVVAEAMEHKEAEEKKRGKAKRPVGNTTDPDSRLQRSPHGGFIQGYNAQVAVSADQIVIAAEVTPDPTDVAMLEPMLRSAQENLTAAGVEAPIEVGLADAGYWSQDNANLEVGVELLIATTKGHKIAQGQHPSPTPAQIEQRNEIISGVHDGQLSIEDAAQELELAVTFVGRLLGRWRETGTTASAATAARHRMETKLAEDHNRQRYRQRGWLIEGSFAHTKTHRHTRRFQRRGRTACDAEWKLINLAGNIAKIHRRRTATPAPTRPGIASANKASTYPTTRPKPTRPHRLRRPPTNRRIRQHQTR
jgi:hypothetical protein